MPKKEYTEGTFGAYLAELLKTHKTTQVGFADSLGISKTYLVDVLNGRLKPPTPEMQEKMITALHLQGQERYEFYDRAAEGRRELPKDITEYLLQNPDQIHVLRGKMKEIL